MINNLNNNHERGFKTLVKKLSFSSQEKVKTIIESSVSSYPGETLDNNTTLTKSPLRGQESGHEQERTMTPRKSSENFDSPNRDRVQKNFKMTTKKTSFAPLQTGKNLLRYGLFEQRVIDDVNNAQDWRVNIFSLNQNF